jgi:hypothetical protein
MPDCGLIFHLTSLVWIHQDLSPGQRKLARLPLSSSYLHEEQVTALYIIDQP